MPKATECGRADALESLEDLLLDRHLAALEADRDLAILAERERRLQSSSFEPGSADREDR